MMITLCCRCRFVCTRSRTPLFHIDFFDFFASLLLPPLLLLLLLLLLLMFFAVSHFG